MDEQIDVDEVKNLRKEYIKMLRFMSEAAEGTEEYTDAQNKMNVAREKLLNQEDQAFVQSIDAQKKQREKFFGDLEKTNRGMIYQVVSNSGNIFSNFTSAIKQDMYEGLLGLGKGEDEGVIKNSFTSRLLGADKYEDLEKQSPQPKVPSNDNNPPTNDGPFYDEENNAHQSTILQEIKENTANTFAVLSEAYKTDLKNDEAYRRRLLENDHEGSALSGISFGNDDEDDNGKGFGIGGLFGAASLANLATAGGAGVLGGAALKGLGIAAKVTAIAGSIFAVAYDGIMGYINSEEWGVSKLAGVVGSIFGGADSYMLNVFTNAGKFALIGATIGSVFPVVGTLVGGLAGAAIGGLLGFIGGEKIAKGIDKAMSHVSNWFTGELDAEVKKIETNKANVEQKLMDSIKEQSTFVEKRNLVLAQIQEAESNNDQSKLKQLKNELQSIDANIQSRNKQISEASTEFNELNGKLEDKTYGFIDKAIEFHYEIFDMIFPDAGINESIGITKEAKEEVLSKLDATNKSIKDLRTQRLDAIAKGNMKEADLLAKQIDDLGQYKENLNKELLRQNGILKTVAASAVTAFGEWYATASDSISRAKTAIKEKAETIKQAVEQTIIDIGNSEFVSDIKGMINNFTGSIKSWFSDIFSVDYWFGDDKPKPKPEQVKIGGRANQIRTSNDVKKPIVVRPLPEPSGMNLTSMNIKQEETMKLIEERKEKRKAQQATANIVDNKNTYNISKHYIMQKSAFNDEPSFAAGVAGVRNTTHTQ